MPGGDDKEGLAALLDRAAQLKKHFQEVLFLEPESRMVDQPSRNLYGPRRRGHGVHHLFCAVNRVLVLREPMRFDKRRRVVLQARESLAPDRLARPDPLNPGSGAAPEIVDQALLLVTR